MATTVGRNTKLKALKKLEYNELLKLMAERIEALEEQVTLLTELSPHDGGWLDQDPPPKFKDVFNFKE